MNHKENRGYQKTHQIVKNHLSNLIEQKDFRQITINELCEGACINRSTFYAHFQDIYDVMDQIAADYDKELLSTYGTLRGKKIAPTEKDYIIALLDLAKSHRKFYQALLTDINNPALRNRLDLLQTYIIEPILQHYQIDKRSGSYYFNFVKAGFFTITKQWLDDNCPESPEKMAEIMFNLKLFSSFNI